jgi:hypothetical protein
MIAARRVVNGRIECVVPPVLLAQQPSGLHVGVTIERNYPGLPRVVSNVELVAHDGAGALNNDAAAPFVRRAELRLNLRPFERGGFGRRNLCAVVVAGRRHFWQDFLVNGASVVRADKVSPRAIVRAARHASDNH